MCREYDRSKRLETRKKPGRASEFQVELPPLYSYMFSRSCRVRKKKHSDTYIRLHHAAYSHVVAHRWDLAVRAA